MLPKHQGAMQAAPLPRGREYTEMNIACHRAASARAGHARAGPAGRGA